MSPRRLLPLGISIATAAILVPAGALAARLAPGDLLASAGKQTVRADLGSYCVSSEPRNGEERGACAAAPWPGKPPRPRLGIVPGQRVELRFRDRPGVEDEIARVSVRLIRLRGEGEHPRFRRRLDASAAQRPRTWEVRLPAGVRRANAIHVQTKLEPDGDASYLVGLRHRVRRCPKGGGDGLAIDSLVGKRMPRARRIAARHGCEVRVIRRNGESLPHTQDFRRDRINVAVKRHRITRVFNVG